MVVPVTVAPFCVCTVSVVMTVWVWVFVCRMSTNLLLLQALHETVVPSENTRWRAAPFAHLVFHHGLRRILLDPAALDTARDVGIDLVAGRVLPVWTPLLKVVVVPFVTSCWMTACCVGVQPQVVGPPSVGKFAVLLPWQRTCSEFVPLGVNVVLDEPVPSRVVVMAGPPARCRGASRASSRGFRSWRRRRLRRAGAQVVPEAVGGEQRVVALAGGLDRSCEVGMPR